MDAEWTGPAPGNILVLRTCLAGGASAHDARFVWPLEIGAEVSAPDWSLEPSCGRGLHGLPWGVGDGSLLSWADSVALVVEVPAGSIVDLDGKCKFPRCTVRYVGDIRGAAALIQRHAPEGVGPCVGGTATAGDRGTATAGDRGTATAGDGGTATAGDGGTATAGDWGTATAGYRGTATAGDGGTATAGDWGTATAGVGGTATAGVGGVLSVRWWDGIQQRFRVAIAEIGFDGPTGLVEAGRAYHVEVVEGRPQFVRAEAI